MNRPGPTVEGQLVGQRGRMLARGLWLCPAISLVLAIAVLVLFGVNWLVAIVAGGLLGCFVAAVWVVIADRLFCRRIERVSDHSGR